MKTEFQTLLQQLLRSPKRFPIETALGVVFFILGVVSIECDNIAYELILFVPFVAISFWLQSANRRVYLASFPLFLILLLFDIEPYIFTSYFFFIYVLAAILLIIGNRRMSNRSFVAHTLHVCTRMFWGLLIVFILYFVAIAILLSSCYIFDISDAASANSVEYIFFFISFVVAPQVCCTLIRQDEYDENKPTRAIREILNFILSPAIIIYTAILYMYLLKTAFVWELPKGGVAWMVLGFISIALVGCMAQSVLSKHYFDWFYNHLTLIAVPALIIYWVGSIYRIRLYSFTEYRFYLIVAGVLMTIFVLMLYKERTRRYQLMALIFGVTIVVFTYIPGISAKSIGLACQKQRMEKLISELELKDCKTGKLIGHLELSAINSDSIKREKYKEFCSIVEYVRDGMGNDKFNERFGAWNYTQYSFVSGEETTSQESDY